MSKSPSRFTPTCQMCGITGQFGPETLHLCQVCAAECLCDDLNSQGGGEDIEDYIGRDPFSEDAPEGEWTR